MSTSLLPRINLTPNETRLKDLLLDLTASLAQDQPNGPVVLRWAGGWVRDKLLGIESNDIDVAINCMTGETFGLELGKFCQQAWVVEKYGIKKDDLHGLHLIRLNPEKSKNLETATTQLFGVDLDFVNLRKETYAQDSRNPEVEFGTAYEDAMRRDATVNAMFYNLHSDSIEDHTGGVADLKDKVIRTPLEPFQTFMDDPLRVLRLVRFASRLGFTIAENTCQCMSDPRVLDALALKITRERVGIELDKMLKVSTNAVSFVSAGNDPRAALELIYELGLYHTIFTNVTQPDMPKPDIANWPTAFNLLHDMSKNSFGDFPYNTLVTDSNESYLAWALACLCPWENIPTPLSGQKPKSKSLPQIVTVAREGFRATNKLSDCLTGSHKNIDEIRRFKDAVLEGQLWAKKRGAVAMMIRRWEGNAMNWRLQILYAMLVEALQYPSDATQELKKLRVSWASVLKELENLNLMDAHLVVGLVDGRTLSKALNKRPGQWMRPALDICLEWQFDNPGVTDITKPIDAAREIYG
ncbi:CCA tRNA nucleotidyltransferase, mitochondrial [Ceratocystis lukuohia]|uniref:CCA tRNA nucleotidyltransferase, mitochondrial n=1 Tax=Ceratocystis lukuohia TaxID=2019550 RepID=A0ABR4MBN9_9PEZI